MDLGAAITIVRSGILNILIIVAPILLVGMGVGLIVSIFQATTSIQEQTLSFVPKIAAILAALFFFGPWMLSRLTQFTIQIFQSIPDVSG